MPASEAQIQANRQNALRSTGPRTDDGKLASRANSLKHGLTGEGVVIPEADALEVNRLSKAYAAELQAKGETGLALARRMAVMSVRMDRSVSQETAALSERVRQTLDEFEAPEDATPEEADHLRDEAARRAMFDPSREACLARKYEAAAERCFFRSLKELRQLRKDSVGSVDQVAAEVVAQAQASNAELASFLPAKPPSVSKPPVATPAPIPSAYPPFTNSGWEPFGPAVDVPFSVGRAR